VSEGHRGPVVRRHGAGFAVTVVVATLVALAVLALIIGTAVGLVHSIGSHPTRGHADSVPTPLNLVTVPKVVGLTAPAATSQLTGRGLKVTALLGVSRSVPAGSVMAQSPAGGSPASPRSTVFITVSVGAKG
jgi:hypothetical protein